MKVSIDQTICCNCMLCVEICPEIFELGESHVGITSETVPPELSKACFTACDECPLRAIKLGLSVYALQ